MNQSDGSNHINISTVGCCYSLYATVEQFESLLKVSLTLMRITAMYVNNALWRYTPEENLVTQKNKAALVSPVEDTFLSSPSLQICCRPIRETTH